MFNYLKSLFSPRPRADWQKRLTLANEIFHTAPKLPTDQELEASEIRDLDVTVSASPSNRKAYIVSVRNSGATAYRDLVLDLQDVVCWAGSFGLDTTHMSSGTSRMGGGLVAVQELLPKAVVNAEVLGYGAHDEYCEEYVRFVRVQFQFAPTLPFDGIKHWCEVAVNLPKARRR